MKKFVMGLLPLAISMFGVTSAMVGTQVTKEPTCDDSQSKTLDVYMTWDTYKALPYDAYWNNDNDVLINGETSVQIWSSGTTISGCYGDTWDLMSNYVKKGHPAAEENRALILRTENNKGCILSKPTKKRNNSTDVNAIFHYTIWFKKVGGSSNLTEKFYYTTRNSSKYYCIKDGARKSNISDCTTSTVWYDPTQKYHRWECMKIRLFRCGDWILDTEYGETCDPKAEPWINNNECDSVTCKGPICNSSYNGQTVSSLVPWNYLCNLWTMTAFQETSTWWTWKCDNVAWTDANCSAKKANNGRLDVEKTLVSETKYVTEVWQELIWEIKVTAKWWNVENVKIKDYLPEVLSYKDKSTVPTLPQWVTMKSTEPTKWADATGSYLQWDTEWTLTAWKSIILRITTKVKTMPKTTDEYENVACARTEWLDEKCDKKPIAKEWEPIIKKTLIWNKTVENIGDILKWKIEITASGWDVSGFVLQDKVPVALEYVNITPTENEDNLSIGNPTWPVLSWKYNIYTWNVKWVLKSEHKLILEMTTKVVEMPTSEDDYKNVACVIKNGKENCDDDKPWNPKLRIKKYILDGDNEVKNIKVNEWDTITYIIHFGNSGKAAATITSIKDFLPKNVQYKSGSIHINRSSTHGDGTQVWDTDLIKWFKVVDGVRIEIYGWMTLEPGDEWYIIITWEIKSEFTDNRTNFACIYLNDKLVDCDNASHDFGTPPPPPGPDPDQKNPYCDYAKWQGNNVFCKVGNARAKMQLTCIHNWKRTILGDKPSGTVLDYEFKNVWSWCDNGRIQCEIWNGDWSTREDCKLSNNESEAPQWCFNVNEWNFSIEEWEIMPFYWNMANLDSDYYGNRDNYTEMNWDYSNAKDNYENGWTCSESKEGKIAKDSMVCTFIIADGSGNHYWIRNGEYEYNYLYKIEWPCLSKNGTAITKKPLIEARYNQMVKNYCDDSRTCYFYYGAERGGIDRFKRAVLPTAVYYIEKFGTGAQIYANVWKDTWDIVWNYTDESNKAFWEYKILLTGVKYSKCENGNWTKQSSDSTCNTNFMLTNSYTVQKTPSWNLKASTTELDKYLSYDGERVFTKLLNAIKTTEYNSNSNVDNAMKTFIDKYSKLAVKVNLWNNSFLEWTDVRKVPWKNIYFVSGSLTVKWWTQSIKTPFTIVQTSDNANVTISWNVQHNMMLLTNWNIIFKWDCESDQTVKWIFYAKGKLNRYAKARNENIDTSVWCTNGWLHVRWVLIWSNFDKLMDNSRSNINDRFIGQESKRKEYVMNWASVLIEYSPSIFSKSTMPPGAEDFTTALSIYKQ